MKEITYDGPDLEKESEEFRKRKERSRGSAAAPTVRTFKADVEELIEEKGTTRAEMVMAEEKRREERGQKRVLEEEDESHLGKMIFILLLVLAFGIGVGAYALLHVKSTPLSGEAGDLPEKSTEIIISSPRNQLLADIEIAHKNTVLPKNSTQKIIFMANEEHATMPADTVQFLRSVAYRPLDESLLRALGKTFTYHIYAGENNVGILTIDMKSYPEVFAKTIEWESRMGEDLLPVINPLLNKEEIPILAVRKFKDKQIGGKDARVLASSGDHTVLAYAFVDKKTLLISGSEEGLASVLSK